MGMHKKCRSSNKHGKKEMIKNIYDKYNERLLKVIENNGEAIPY